MTHPIRQLICDVARSQEGNDDPSIYWLDALGYTPGPPHWCGAFALWSWHRCGILVGVDWVVGSGLSHPRYGLALTRHPEPGDLAYFTRHQHYALVTDVSRDAVALVNGNSRNKSNPTGPTKVIINERKRRDVAAFYSIEKHL